MRSFGRFSYVLIFSTSCVGVAKDKQSEASEAAKQKMDDVSSQASRKADQVCLFARWFSRCLIHTIAQAASGVKKAKDEMKK